MSSLARRVGLVALWASLIGGCGDSADSEASDSSPPAATFDFGGAEPGATNQPNGGDASQVDLSGVSFEVHRDPG